MGQPTYNQMYPLRATLRTVIRITMVCGALLAVGLLVALPEVVAQARGNLLVGVLMLLAILVCALFAWVMYDLGFRSYLAISAQGIRFRAYGITGETTWDNLNGFRKLDYGKAMTLVITTRRPMNRSRSWIYWLLFFWYPAYVADNGTYIPLAEFIQDSYHLSNLKAFQRSNIGKLLAEYAPQIFTEDSVSK